MINRDDLKKRVKFEESEIEKSDIQLPEETVFAAIKRASMLLRNVRANKIMNTAFMSKAYEIAQSIQASVKDLGIKAYIPEIDVCKDPEETAKSLSAYIDACMKAGKDIEKVKKEASRKLEALASAVDKAVNPDEKKVKAHVRAIIAGMNDEIFNPSKERQNTQQNMSFSIRKNIQNRKLNAVIDWEAVKIEDPQLYMMRGKLNNLTYSDIVELYRCLKNSPYVKHISEEEDSEE